jgi:hypothetical protein
MAVLKRAVLGALVVGLVLTVRGPLWAQKGRPLTEADLSKLVELQIDDAAIAAKLKAEGVGFAVDGPAVERLKKAGASDAVIAAARAAGAAPKAAGEAQAVTYQDVLKLLLLGLDEPTILRRLEKSPTTFTLDAGQVDELKRAGATEGLLATMQGGHRAPAATAGAKVTDFAIVLDCSGSMAERTRDGQVKIEVAKRVVADLVQKMPEGLRVTFVIYGYDRDLNCQAVRVARPLGPLDAGGKSELAAQIAALRPVGGTPIALALEAAGRELARNDAPCGLVLLTDGK